MQINFKQLIVASSFVALTLTGCDQQPATEQADASQDSNQAVTEFAQDSAQEIAQETAQEVVVEITELVKIDIVDGDGAEAQVGQEVVVHYTGWLYEPGADDNKGQQFDSSIDRGDPFAFPLGGKRVIRGWDEGVVGMQVGGKRTLIIPADMAYGDRGAGAVIQPGATLIFDVELLEIQ
jgi:FKBP-type peptidyl-prolyl cis-trans isomerase FkpA